MNKPIILEIDNVRIRKWDDQNYFIERKETYFNPKEKAETIGYKFKGYYPTVFKALKAISDKELLVNEKAISDLKSYLNEVTWSNMKVIFAIENAVGDSE